MPESVLLLDRRSNKLGSARIYIHNLAAWFNELGIPSAVNDWEGFPRHSICLFGKGSLASELRAAKSANSRLLVGLVEPNDLGSESNAAIEAAEFFLVGSLTQKDYLRRFNKPVIWLPLLESGFLRSKVHEDKGKLLLGYHGNFDHLAEFEPYLKPALEKLAQEYPIALKVVYDVKKFGSWQFGRPDVEVIETEWSLESIEEELLQIDIGLVPGLYPINQEDRRLLFETHSQLYTSSAMYDNDYLIRFKNSSNAGRAFVFHQLGIPVVADFIPECFPILSQPGCGFIAHYSEGWLAAIKALCGSAAKRQLVADNARREFQRLYDPLLHAQRVYTEMLDILRGKTIGCL